MPEKKDAYSTPAMKVLRLYILLLFSGRKYSLAELARKFDCSKQTILRMMEQINLSKFEQVDSWEEEGRRYFRAKTPPQRPNLALDVEAIQHLLLCRDIVWHIFPPALRQEIEETIAQTTVLLPDFNQRSEALTSFARNHAKGSIDYSRHQEILKSLLNAIQKKRICQVVYRSSSARKIQELRIAPFKLVAYHDGLFVRARLEESLANPEGNIDRILAVHRIVSLQKTDKTFQVPVDRKKQPKQTFGFMEGKPFRVKVAFGPAAAAYVSERTWSDDQKLKSLPDGGLLLEFTATSRPEVLSWVLSFRTEAQLLEPADIREELASIVEALADVYSSGSPEVPSTTERPGTWMIS
jgi:predicted DNA-binding transcriptional regulator YafY